MKKILHMDIMDLNFLCNPANFEDPGFMQMFINRAVGNFPLGIGFQFQKAVHGEKGITRTDRKYNYTANTGRFPAQVPILHLLGQNDVLASPATNMLLDAYPHDIKQRIVLGQDDLSLPFRQSHVTYLEVPNTGHIDLLYGKTAEEYVYPSIFEAIRSMWPFDFENIE